MQGFRDAIAPARIPAAMPIYAYRCEHCGHEKDAIQKFSDPPLTVCPACGVEGGFKKQLTAPAFQLKGSGWYVTDFRDGNKGKAAKPAPDGAAAAGEGGADAKTGADAKPPDGKPADAAKPAVAADAKGGGTAASGGSSTPATPPATSS
jgi:putative FmdB family regulatory protein